MEVEDESLSSTDIDSAGELEDYISLTDINTDSDSDFILIHSEDGCQPDKGVSTSTDQLSATACKSSSSESTTLFTIQTDKSKTRKTKRDTPIVIQLSQSVAVMNKRKDFISDSSSEDELPVMDSLRARLAKKRQNAIASPFLPEEKCEQPRKTTLINSHAIIDTGVSSPNADMVSEVQDKAGEDSPPDFSDTSGDEDEQQPLSSFLSSPSQKTYHGTVKDHMLPNSDSDLSVRSADQPKCGSASYKRPVGNQKTGTRLTETDAGTIASSSDVKPAEAKIRKKRTVEEIEENKRKAQEKKEERERMKAAKEAEKQRKKIERESKKQFSLGSCLKFVKVLVDTHIMNTPGFGAVLFKACEELGVTCVTEQLVIPYSVMWKREVTECSMSSEIQVETIHNEIIEHEVLALVPTADFVQMVYNFKQRQIGVPVEGVTLRSYVNTIKSHLSDKSITIVAQGIEQYFRDMKNQDKRQHREAVLSTDPNYIPGKNNKQKARMLQVSRVDIEEAVTDTQLQTCCCTLLPETQEDVADLVRRFSKAVAERPAKKDRFDPIFSFHEEGSAGVKVDRSGHGLLKVWKQQLLQFKNVSPDVAQALIAEYPSPQLLRQAYLKCTSEKEAVRLLENIVVRRGAGVLETSRRIGKELSRRIHTFLTSDDPNLVIK